MKEKTKNNIYFSIGIVMVIFTIWKIVDIINYIAKLITAN